MSCLGMTMQLIIVGIFHPSFSPSRIPFSTPTYSLKASGLTTRKIAKDASHPTYNSIPGRYANRIGKATFTVDGKTYRTQRNDGQNTLHSGTNNWSYRVWNVTAVTARSITFSLVDRDGESTGMPGRVDANVTYSVGNGTWSTRMVATAEARTRAFIMSSSCLLHW